MEQATLEEIERRAVSVNVALNGLQKALCAGDVERALNLCEVAREGNWVNRRALLQLGVKDSIRADAGVISSPQEDDLIDADALDLAELGKIVKREQEGKE